jgi:hypothetical protein
VAVGLLVGAAGCANNTMHPTASPMQHPTLENIPLPDGFRLVDDQSFGVASGQMRVGKFTFEGSADRTAVCTFFKEYMPSGGWKLKKEDFDRGILDMRFESGSEECTVRLRSPRDNLTLISVHVMPLPRTGTERAKEAPVRRPAREREAG